MSIGLSACSNKKSWNDSNGNQQENKQESRKEDGKEIRSQEVRAGQKIDTGKEIRASRQKESGPGGCEEKDQRKQGSRAGSCSGDG
ncbi:MAG: hypothetical protein KDK25_08190 [Leptospiraceae bacterium]|nr:hypothetical protein [Leptospiraceae bacterium]